MNKDEFGGACWTTLHALAGNALELDKREAFCRMVRALKDCFPCHHCADHLGETLSRNPVERKIKNAEELLRWTYDAHDAANKHYNKANPDKPQKHSPGWDSVKRMYLAIPDENEIQVIKKIEVKKTPAFNGLKQDIKTNFRPSRK